MSLRGSMSSTPSSIYSDLSNSVNIRAANNLIKTQNLKILKAANECQISIQKLKNEKLELIKQRDEFKQAELSVSSRSSGATRSLPFQQGRPSHRTPVARQESSDSARQEFLALLEKGLASLPRIYEKLALNLEIQDANKNKPQPPIHMPPRRKARTPRYLRRAPKSAQLPRITEETQQEGGAKKKAVRAPEPKKKKPTISKK